MYRLKRKQTLGRILQSVQVFSKSMIMVPENPLYKNVCVSLRTRHDTTSMLVCSFLSEDKLSMICEYHVPNTPIASRLVLWSVEQWPAMFRDAFLDPLKKRATFRAVFATFMGDSKEPKLSQPYRMFFRAFSLMLSIKRSYWRSP
jgi:hypothetical protein